MGGLAFPGCGSRESAVESGAPPIR
jgi:hypothetical protein